MEIQIVCVMILLLTVLLSIGIWVGPALCITSWLLLQIFTDLPITSILGTTLWNTVNSSSLIALPLFIVVGELIGYTKIPSQLFEGLGPWVARLPGGLLHLNVLGCALFAATTGSTNATTVAIGKITVPELTQRGYKETLTIGSLASAGTLGILIPPSIPMLIYGITANVSIGKLFIAGFVPGISLMILFCLYIVIVSRKYHYTSTDSLSTLITKKQTISKILPICFLILLVFTSIYSGYATPTEAATISLLGVITLGVVTKTLSLTTIFKCLKTSACTDCMIMMTLIGASFFSTTLSFMRIPQWISTSIIATGSSKISIILLITITYLILGCLIDGYSIIIITVPIFLPVITALDLNLIWFGIFVIIMVEAANITPPIGFNLFLVSGITNHGIGFISKSVLPFLSIMLLFICFMTIFPEYILFLPNLLTP